MGQKVQKSALVATTTITSLIEKNEKGDAVRKITTLMHAGFTLAAVVHEETDDTIAIEMTVTGRLTMVTMNVTDAGVGNGMKEIAIAVLGDERSNGSAIA